MTKARSNAVAEAAKGDLSVGSGTNLAGILAVGNNGETLVADSSTSTGLRYTAGTVQSNPVLNSAFQVWQRGTTISTSSGLPYTADRWQLGAFSTTGRTVSRQNTNDTTNLPFIQYCARVQRDAGNTGTASVEFGQSMESINCIPFAGKTVTFSFYARAGANYSTTGNTLSSFFITGTGTDQNFYNGFTGQANNTQVNTLTTTWQRFTQTLTLPSTVTQIAPAFGRTPTGTAGAADFYEITGIQIDIGSVALPFRTYAGTIQGELAACQYYFYRLVDGSQQSGEQVSVMQAGSGNGAFGTLRWGNMMRVAPTFTVSSPAHYGLRGATLTGPFACSVISAGSISRRTAQMNITTSTGGVLTAGNATTWEAISASATMDLSAEL